MTERFEGRVAVALLCRPGPGRSHDVRLALAACAVS
jgi:hypothetical protein